MDPPENPLLGGSNRNTKFPNLPIFSFLQQMMEWSFCKFLYVYLIIGMFLLQVGNAVAICETFSENVKEKAKSSVAKVAKNAKRWRF